MKHWTVETLEGNPILTHYCGSLRSGDGCGILRTDISGGYSCERCGEKFVPFETTAVAHLTLRLRETMQLSAAA